jgi:hypothetical protein
MGTIISSLVVIAVGAILRFAVTASVDGVVLSTVGLVLMIVGAVGLALGLYFKLRESSQGRFVR